MSKRFQVIIENVEAIDAEDAVDKIRTAIMYGGRVVHNDNIRARYTHTVADTKAGEEYGAK